ncbi:MAG: hypothetical protein AAFQ84_04940 [Pseudomonadota bacterium]
MSTRRSNLISLIAAMVFLASGLIASQVSASSETPRVQTITQDH